MKNCYMNYFQTTRQTTKIRNAFANNMPTDIKLSKTQISKISGGSFGSSLGKLGKKQLTNIAIPLVRDNLPALVSNLTLNATSKSKKKKRSGKGAVSKTWNKKRKMCFYGALLSPLAAIVQPMISSVVKGMSGREVRRTGRGYMNENF